MTKKCIIITSSVIVFLVLAATFSFLIWWLIIGRYPFVTVDVNVQGVGNVTSSAAFARIRGVGDMFWWFYPTQYEGELPTSRPIILWLDGVTGLPPSLLANFGMFGPYDFNLERRENSWVDKYNLLFVDAPMGTGFSAAISDNHVPTTLEQSTDQLCIALESFYSRHEAYMNTSFYIFGQGHGAQLALALADRITDVNNAEYNTSIIAQINLTAIALGNPIISPALTMTKLGVYLEELAYIDDKGRAAIESLSDETNAFVNNDELESAFDNFLSLGEYVNKIAGAVAVNLGYIVEKLTRESTNDYFNNRQYIEKKSRLNSDLYNFMDDTVSPKLGITRQYDKQRDVLVEAYKDSFMVPATWRVEHILRKTTIPVTIYNGNLDATSNTLGQLEWVNNLEWERQNEFLNQPRETLIINNQIEGYYREIDRLQFFWINVAGQSVPLDNPVAIQNILERITNSTL